MTHLAQASDEWTLQEAAHLLNRAGFGGAPDEIRRFHRLGRRAAVASLIEPDEPLGAFPLPEWATKETALADLRQRVRQFMEMRRATQTMTAEEAERARRGKFQEEQRENRQRGVEAQGWWFRRMLHSKAPLREKMTLFWHDHFATSIQKVKQPVLMVMQNELFRREALGDFRALTHAIVRDPAMMLYLDTQSSKKGRPNENFARELLELFTLGEGHYSEEDIRQAARAFTGYSLDRMNGEVEHNRRQWDDGVKTVFGKSGPFDGDDVIDLIFDQPQAARYVPAKLWAFFVAEDPPPAVVDALAASFRAAKFKVAPVLREIFLASEFYAEPVIRDQIKSPIQFLIQLLKQLELDDVPRGYPLLAQEQLGQMLFMPPNVAGWDWGKAWINTNTLLTRYNIAGFLTKGATDSPANDETGGAMMMEAQGAKPTKKGQRFADQGFKGGAKSGQVAGLMSAAARFWPGPDYDKIAPRELRARHGELVDELGFRFFQAPLPALHRKRFLAFAEEQQGPVFTNHEVAQLVHLMLSTPDYQLT